MSIFLVVTPADYFTAETTLSSPDPAVLETMIWRGALLKQDEYAYTFGAPATVIADLGYVPARADSLGDPDWADLLLEVECAGYDYRDAVYATQLIPYGMWMKCSPA